jgi:hypothetical protein
MRDEVACAVTFAVTHAAEYGADPDRLVLLGHSAGANEASVVTHGEPLPLPECRAAARTWTPRGVVLWERRTAHAGHDVGRLPDHPPGSDGHGDAVESARQQREDTSSDRRQ